MADLILYEEMLYILYHVCTNTHQKQTTVCKFSPETKDRQLRQLLAAEETTTQSIQEQKNTQRGNRDNWTLQFGTRWRPSGKRLSRNQRSIVYSCNLYRSPGALLATNKPYHVWPLVSVNWPWPFILHQRHNAA